MPNIMLSAEYSHFAQGDEYKISGDDFGSYYQVGIGVQIPLFTGLSNTAKVKKIKHTLNQSEISLNDAKDKIELDILNSYNNLENKLKKLESQRKNVGLAKKGLEIAETRFENDISIQLELIDAQLQLKTAKLNQTKAVYDTIIAYEKLKKAAGINYQK